MCVTQCDTGVIHESGMYHTLHNMDINTYKTKCDRVTEKWRFSFCRF